DPAGNADVSAIDLLFNSSLNFTGACWIHYVRTSNSIFLYNDAGNAFVAGSVTPGGAGVASNSQCTISSGGPVTPSGNTLNLPVSISFNTPNFQDTKNVYGMAAGFNGGTSGWVLKGTWTTIIPQSPTVNSVTPINGTGTTQTFSVQFGDPAGSGT